MIRFVDLRPYYWSTSPGQAGYEEDSAPICAFIDTVTDRFVEVDDRHTFTGDDDIPRTPLGERMRSLVPVGYWKR